MKNPSRRAFFGGRAPEISAWDQFLLQLQRKVQGELGIVDTKEKQAVLTASVIADLHHARQLCHAFGVKLYSCGRSHQTHEHSDLSEAVLWLDMSALNQLLPVDETKSQWFMQSGVSIGQLKDAGFDALQSLPDALQVGDWLSDPKYQQRPSAHLVESGLVHASLLMADGSVSSLGAFGEKNTKPLNTALLRQLVPQLFQLLSTEVAQQLLQQPHWLGRYRVDLFAGQADEINLAYLLLGNKGDLGVVEWVVLSNKTMRFVEVVEPSATVESLLKIQAEELDAAVKQLFDAEFLFSSN